MPSGQEQKGKTAYLGGKMRGIPYWNFPAFDEATEKLRADGWTIFSPAEHDRQLMKPGEEPPADGGEFGMLAACLDWDYARIAEADCMIVLPGWETSTGVHWEMVVAFSLDKPILAYPDLTLVKPPVVVTNPTAPPELAAKNFHEVRVIDPNTGGAKGSKDERMDLLPMDALLELARHYHRGSQKYEDRNWEKGYAWSLSYAALLRHLAKWWSGQECDEEGFPHITAVAWHALALLAFSLRDIGVDNRHFLDGFDD